MPLSRRRLIALVGGGTIAVAAGGATIFATTRTPETALKPWELAGTETEPRRKALSYALLAPNPHNLQPWLVELKGDDTVILHRDPNRALPETDPFGRQLTIGLGCFLELMRMAAAQDGWSVALDPFPEGENGPVAMATFSKGDAEPDPLFAHVMERRSCKEPFEDRAVPPESVAAVSEHARVIDDDASVSALRALTWDAWLVETHHGPTYRESVELMRIGKAEINANPDGIDLGGPFLETLSLVGMLDRESLLDTKSEAFRQGEVMYSEMLNATPAYAVLTSRGNTRLDQLEAGRRWVRLNLATTGLGLALHPVSQALQEFPEMKAHYDKAHALLAEPGHTVQMLGRLGYGPQTARTPRWPLESRMLNA